MIKKVFSYLILCSILFICHDTAFAQENIIDFSKKGSIEITLTEKTENTLIKDAQITIYKVGNAVIKDNNLVYEYTDKFNECDANLTNINDPLLASKISKCINEDIPSITKITNKNGKVKFSDLDLGLYLVSQTKSVEGYSNIDSFLVMLPEVIDNKWVYDIKSEPKTDIYRMFDLVVNKIWNSHSKELPKEVTIVLYKGENIVDTIKLNEENNWTYTFKNIEKSDKYSVKEINIPKGYTPSYKMDENVFTVINNDTLVYTGQVFYPIIICFSIGAILVALGIKTINKETYE